MKTSFTTLVLVLLLLSILAGCAPGPNPFKKMASEHGEIAGFWLGLWQGFIAPVVFVASLFRGDLNVYEVHNTGPWYNFGYLFGLRASSEAAATGHHGGAVEQHWRPRKNRRLNPLTLKLSRDGLVGSPSQCSPSDRENALWDTQCASCVREFGWGYGRVG